MSNIISLSGIIKFDPDNITKKHNVQSSWKRVAFVEFDGDVCDYYAWFINRRYNLQLNRPLRKPHISFINDSIRDLTRHCSEDEADEYWKLAKAKWNSKDIKVTFDVSPRSNGQHWWLNVPEDQRKLLHEIRAEVGLGRPYFGLHMSIGYANERNIDHSNYILRMIKNGLIID